MDIEAAIRKFVDQAEERVKELLGRGEATIAKVAPAALPAPDPPPATVPSAVAFWWTELHIAAHPVDLPVAFLAAVAWHESGHTLDPATRGFDGHGRGAFQIDDRYHPEVTDQQAFDFQESALWAAFELARLRAALSEEAESAGIDPLQAALAGYNAGEEKARLAIHQGMPIGYYTYHQSYVTTVWDWYKKFSPEGGLIA